MPTVTALMSPFGTKLSAPSNVITIGDGIKSYGRFNGTDQQPFIDAINEATGYGLPIVVMPGAYVFTAPVSITSGVQILAFGNPSITVNHSSSVGAFNCDVILNTEIDGINFIANTWVASQVVVDVDPATGLQNLTCKFKNNTFQFGTGIENDFAPTFAAGNEMIGLAVTGGVSTEIDNNVIYPNKGVTGIKCDSGFGNIVERNKVKNAAVVGFPLIGDAQRRPCYIGIDMQSETSAIVRGNIFQGLGLIDAAPPRVDRRLTHALRLQWPNIAKAVVEFGHTKAYDNIFENCLTDTTCVVDMRGPRWVHFGGGYFCFNGTASALGSGFIRVTDANADRTGTNAYAYQCQISGVHFHNAGTGDAACVYINSASDLTIQGCTFHELNSTAAIVVDPAAVASNVLSLTVLGCKASWPTATPNDRWLINRIGTTANAAKDLFCDGNACSTGDASFIVDGIYNGTVFAGKHGVKGIVVNSTGVETASDIGTNQRFLGQ